MKHDLPEGWRRCSHCDLALARDTNLEEHRQTAVCITAGARRDAISRGLLTFTHVEEVGNLTMVNPLDLTADRLKACMNAGVPVEDLRTEMTASTRSRTTVGMAAEWEITAAHWAPAWAVYTLSCGEGVVQRHTALRRVAADVALQRSILAVAAMGDMRRDFDDWREMMRALVREIAR